VLGHQAHAAVCCERSLVLPFGLAGGRPGGPMRLWLELPDGSTRPLNSKGAFIVPANGRLVMEAPGSGGYGPPAGRDPALLREDLANGYVTAEAVRHDYGGRD
jgi:N-methylhydantoinase B